MPLRTKPNVDGGLIYASEGERLRYLASQVTGGCIVELGSYTGVSTCYLADGAPDGVDVYAIDLWDESGADFRRDVYKAPGVYEEFCRRIRDAGHEDRVTAIRARTIDVAFEWPLRVGLLFIDADHRYESTLADYEAWSPLVVQGGVIAFHDYPHRRHGPERVIHEIVIPSGEWGDFQLVDRLWTAVRL